MARLHGFPSRSESEPGDSAALMPSSGILTQLHGHRSRTRRSELGDGYLRRGRRGQLQTRQRPRAQMQCILEVGGNRNGGPATLSAGSCVKFRYPLDKEFRYPLDMIILLGLAGGWFRTAAILRRVKESGSGLGLVIWGTCEPARGKDR
jgi:hypothetical protein